MTLSQNIFDIEERLMLLMQEMHLLRQEALNLEAENRNLRANISPERLRGEGYHALLKLYDEGFHICPAHFATSRNQEECLFCLSFLHKEQNKL